MDKVTICYTERRTAMITAFLILTLGLFTDLSSHSKSLVVIDRTMNVKIDPGFALKDDDTTLVFKHVKYLMQTKEVFDQNGEISSAIIEGDVGYSIYSRKEIYKFKDFLDEYQLYRFVKVCIIDNYHIKLNNEIVTTKEIISKKKEIFYTLKDKDVLYKITYK
jgi:hypothetical protein